MRENVYRIVKCNYCGSRNYKVIIKASKPVDFNKIFSTSKSVRGVQQIVKCKNCGLIYVNPQIEVRMLNRSYSKDSNLSYVDEAESRIDTFCESIKIIDKYFPQRGKILDVGAGSGFFLKVARDEGWRTWGVELSKWLSNYANEKYSVNIKQGTLKEAKFKDNYFDVITMWDVIEHLPNPDSELKEICRVLKPGGMLVVNYPDIGTPVARVMGSKWWFLFSTHLFYFDRRLMKKLLEKNNFENFEFKAYWQTISWGHLAEMLGLYSVTFSKIIKRILVRLGWEKVRVRYYAGQNTVIVRKTR
ncbi:MAG: Methyltransferase type 12 [Candidatus Shapirobacteria bacterium GW2011_GWE1_38_10]|uniref:Methyltransferase type 12 n=1 Tax=Candidatus Shapirobacteria bacterium GW2011_GWE1_38_10 TaxID=1618488 RepID=A0A0G0KKD6_9BACT|nr:MAG: Methyltransferase type 12 [Candidatus Shapirobacteria bacterium GW2011_GWF2_37_20]KKQ49619.1 MAG: Methyltransferase type 12 [Candidatus Shapirobacteria bacterium GW2011_GWE1_38_10]KKQ64597.1 MAG: Methyltransferase type 12 [Candidatus Shapirobacteria bacterium GW2011_GWF1_38_23]